MSVGSLFRSSYLLYFSQPAADRALYRAARGKPIRSIVELGIGLPGRTPRLLEVARWRAQNLPLRYTVRKGGGATTGDSINECQIPPSGGGIVSDAIPASGDVYVPVWGWEGGSLSAGIDNNGVWVKVGGHKAKFGW